MDDWDDLRFVLALERAGTLRGAAKLLNVNHATVSRRLESLNFRHKSDVFERVVGGYRSTVLGTVLVAAAKQVEAAVLEAEQKLREQEDNLGGLIKLSIPEAFGQFLLQDDLAEFCSLYPGVELRIESSYNLADLDQAEADVVIRGTDTPPDHLVGRRLFPYSICYYAHTDYLASVPPDEYGWIAGMQDAAFKALIARSPFPDAPVKMRIADIGMRHKMALAGHGMYVGACYMGDPEPDLVRVPGAAAVLQRDLWVLTHPDIRQVPRVQALTRFLVEALTRKKDLIMGAAVAT